MLTDALRLPLLLRIVILVGRNVRQRLLPRGVSPQRRRVQPPIQLATISQE